MSNIDRTAKKIVSPITSIFEGPPMIPQEKAKESTTPMPLEDKAKTRREGAVASRRRRGRQSTILTALNSGGLGG